MVEKWIFGPVCFFGRNTNFLSEFPLPGTESSPREAFFAHAGLLGTSSTIISENGVLFFGLGFDFKLYYNLVD